MQNAGNSPFTKIVVGSLLLLVHCCQTVLAESPFTPITVYTDRWPPLVNGPHQPEGAVTHIVELALRSIEQERREPQWRYIDFYLAYDMVKNGEIHFAYPFFETQERKKNDPSVLFSDAIMQVRSALYYSAAHNQIENCDAIEPVDPDARKETVNPAVAAHHDALTGHVVGRVKDYSYGDALEPYLQGARVFLSEVLALRALFDNEIDILPMTEKVGQALVLEHFPWRFAEFRKIKGCSSTDDVKMIAHNNAANGAFIEQFNAALKLLKEDQKIEEARQSLLKPSQSSGYIRLVAGDGHPVVIGQTHSNKAHADNRFFMIPQGTRALVLDWSEAVLQEFNSDQLYPTMSELTHIRIVDGPHIGRDAFVKNLHIEIE